MLSHPMELLLRTCYTHSALYFQPKLFELSLLWLSSWLPSHRTKLVLDFIHSFAKVLTVFPYQTRRRFAGFTLVYYGAYVIRRPQPPR